MSFYIQGDILIKIILMSSLIVLSGCSNISVGFEEDSIFYTPPTEVVNEEVLTKKRVVKKSVPTIQTDTTKTLNKEVLTTKRVVKKSTPIVPTKPQKIKHQEKDTENTTTFSYDPYDGE